MFQKLTWELADPEWEHQQEAAPQEPYSLAPRCRSWHMSPTRADQGRPAEIETSTQSVQKPYEQHMFCNYS